MPWSWHSPGRRFQTVGFGRPVTRRLAPGDQQHREVRISVREFLLPCDWVEKSGKWERLKGWFDRNLWAPDLFLSSRTTFISSSQEKSYTVNHNPKSPKKQVTANLHPTTCFLFEPFWPLYMFNPLPSQPFYRLLGAPRSEDPELLEFDPAAGPEERRGGRVRQRQVHGHLGDKNVRWKVWWKFLNIIMTISWT